MKNPIISDIALALTDHDTAEMGGANFFDLTDGNVLSISLEYMYEDITDDDLNSYSSWEQELIKCYKEHDLVRIDPISSSRSFQIMEDFVDNCPQDKQKTLTDALCKKHPFSHFHEAVERAGMLQQWYDFKNKAEEQLAKEWFEDNDINLEKYNN